MPKKALLLVARILFGLVFMFSGFVKAIDPWGSAYKFQDYFLAFGMEWLFPLALTLALALSTLEFVIGLAVLLGLQMRLAAWGGLLFMLFFTPLTLYVALTDPVPDCGCFGDAIIMSNWETFTKNVFLLGAALIVFFHRQSVKPLISLRTDRLLTAMSLVFILGLSVYCLRNLPIMDFRPWHIGADIRELLNPVPEEADIYLIYEHKESGERREYRPDELPWEDADWAGQWRYVDRRSEVIRPAREAPIDAFYIEDDQGHDLTEYYLSEPGPLLVVVAHDLRTTRTRAFRDRINPLAARLEETGYPIIVLTDSPLETIDDFRHAYQTPYPFYMSDGIELKTMVRSNPGMLLVVDGVIQGKWAHRNIPDADHLLHMINN